MRRQQALELQLTLSDQRSVIEELREELAAERREPAEWLSRVTTRKILFHLRNNTSVEGFLKSNHSDGVVLLSPAMRVPDADPVQMGGEVFIPRANILLAQLIDA